MARSLILAGLVLTLVMAAPASAEFKGSPGRVAYIQGTDPMKLKMWDPAQEALDPGNPDAGVTTIEEETFQLPEGSTQSLGTSSPPVWSPDGTRIAYVKSIPDDGNWPSRSCTR